MNWTNEQQQAIQATGSLLVSAAAGSGKTSVLVARVLRKLLSKKPCSIGELLLITFSNAAAEQIKLKICQNLQNSIELYPQKRAHLQLQLDLIDTANCCTFHAFCLKILRENAALLGLSPTFRIASEQEVFFLKQSAFKTIIERFYKKKDWQQLANLCEFYYDDDKLFENVLKFYNFSRSKPFYKDFWQKILNYYSAKTLNIQNDKFIQVILEYSENILKFCADCAQTNLQLAQKHNLIKLYACLQDDISLINELIGTLKAPKSLAFVHQHVSGVKLLNMPPCKNDSADPQILHQIAQTRKLIRENLDTLKSRVLCFDEETITQDKQYSFRYFDLLIEIISAFDAEFSAIKRNKNLIDFADIEHFSLELLYHKTQNKQLQKSSIAQEITNSFNEILVDEFQDINEVQNLIINAVSKNYSNVFMVGDVKQSIYRFRHAVPEIFIAKKDSLPDYDGSTFPARIFLKHNFRPTKAVVDAINFIFSQIMTKSTAAINYDKSQELIPGITQTFCEPGFKLSIIEHQANSTEAMQIEAKYIADYIVQKIINPNFVIEDNGTLRHVNYGDFCILLRSTKDSIDIYRNALIDANIPVALQLCANFWQSKEITKLIAILKAINNPTQSISLAAAMHSCLFSFSLDEITKLRLTNKNESLYNNVIYFGSSKCLKLLATLKELSDFFLNNSLYDSINYIYTQKHYLAFSLIENKKTGQIKTNLKLFLNLAKQAEALGISSLYDFINYIEQEQAAGSAPNQGASDDIFNINAVKIISIHKAKGLEFPICFIANTAKDFNKVDIISRFLLHRELGTACVKYSKNRAFQTSTIFREAMISLLHQEMFAEELRLLYVALTRAKFQIIVPIITANFKDQLEKIMLIKNATSLKGLCFPALRHHQNFADLILFAMLSHQEFCTKFNVSNDNSIKADAKFEFELVEPSLSGKKTQQTVIKQNVITNGSANSKKLLTIIKDNMNYVYPYSNILNLPASISVSKLLERSFYKKFDLTPVFLTDQKTQVTAAAQGSIMHRFMQFCSYKTAAANLKQELARLIDDKILTPQEATSLPQEELKAFFKSAFYFNIIKKAVVIHREVKFSVNLPSSKLFAQAANSQELINIHGIADCVLELDDQIYLLDFKSDKISSIAQLAQKYKHQLYIYKAALAPNFTKPITKLFLYSWFLNQEVEILEEKNLEKLTPKNF
ncbi:MAG: UvrD-helicase domain-containing protein [Oscillospiraceae bacterium]